MLHCKPAKSIINNSRSDWFFKANTLVWAEQCARWAELKMLSFWAGGISSFPSCAREYRLLRRLDINQFITHSLQPSTRSSSGDLRPNLCNPPSSETRTLTELYFYGTIYPHISNHLLQSLYSNLNYTYFIKTS